MDKGKFGRRDRLVQEKRHDVYREVKKWPEPTSCTRCGAVFQNGRWQWPDKEPIEANNVVCPACQRIADKYPAGHIELKGEYLESHWQEIHNLVHNEEKMEKGEHPQERVMAIEKEKELALITTTGIHIARRLGEAISRACSGELSYTYGDGEKTIRVFWNR